ncbi:NAD-dependent epimerase/dehydratase [Kockovaella imperatae]|uniref:NAD-dependent epimerase/dehydratase n=1 Tax=Kockovaella imperatae TaxID=4999 RepID=A0A1Y1UPQ9_9TREE|nr:NAD-dependent epimerase/dehydratase [Kockovaella imperatae]ORX39125.1 NAD-dependent epimerase/dehydratase [Kockovaella imperatae]
MRIFLTGASGFIGSYLTKELIAHGHTVIGLARSDASARKVQVNGATPLRGDLNDLEILASGAREADAVIHCAFIHDFDNPNFDIHRNAAVDVAAFRAMAEAIKGTDKPIISTNGTLGAAVGATLTEDTPKEDGNYRKPPEDLVAELGRQGTRAILIRLPPTVHGVGDVNFVAIMIATAKRLGYSQYVGSGESHWPTVNVKDAVTLYRMAIEQPLPAGTVLHGIDGHVKTKDIAEMIGRKLGVPTKSVSAEEALSQLGFIGLALSLDNPVTKEKTMAATGWQPSHIGLLEDLDKNYF